MSTQRVNAGEKDLEKFIKFLTLKSTQVIVQSRLGEKMQTQCNPLATGNDWYNIVVDDHPDICTETKKALSLAPGENILQRFPICVEISLKTVEGDQMILEVWSIDVQQTHSQSQKDKDDKFDAGVVTKGEKINTTTAVTTITTTMNSCGSDQQNQTIKAAHTIYNRMGVLLKSLITLTRATPAYKLSRRQCADSYGIYYRIYCDRPQIHTLGEGHRNVKIGQLNTIIGTLTMSVAYRTKMTITPTAQVRKGDGNMIMLDSNYFRPSDNGNPTPTQGQNTLQLKKGVGCGVVGGNMGGVANGFSGTNGVSDRKTIDIDKPLRPGAFTDIAKLRQFTEEDYILPETPPFEWLLRKARNESICSGSIESLNRKLDLPASISTPPSTQIGLLQHRQQQNDNINIANFNNKNNHNNNNVTAFKSLENDEADIPKKSPSSQSVTALFVLPTSNNITMAPTTTTTVTTPTPNVWNSTSPHSSPSASTTKTNQPTTVDDDNLLKELNFPFASNTSHVNDLAKFYRDCYNAPPLQGLTELQANTMTGCGVAAYAGSSLSVTAAAVDDLSRQLEGFETCLEDYDKMFSQLGLSASSSTGSRSSGGLQMSN